jgi:RNA recognition motif-containing protein
LIAIAVTTVAAMKVLEIIAIRSEGLRGQAWVLFDDVQSATAALQAEQGFTFFGKDLKIQYAKEKSDRIAKRDGTYVPKSKRIKKSVGSTDNGDADDGDDSNDHVATDSSAAVVDSTNIAIPHHDIAVTASPPSPILLASNLPTECNEMMLAMLFQQYAGYKEVRMPRPGLAFIEFDDEPHATLAMRGLQGFQLTKQEKLILHYGKS